MTLAFPQNPVLDQTYPDPPIACTPIWRWDGVSWKLPCDAGAMLEVSPTAPANPQPNTLWFDSDAGALYLWFDNGSCQQWISVSGNRGPQGPRGEDGQDGLQGEQGLQGPRGNIEHVAHVRMTVDQHQPAGWVLLNYNSVEVNPHGWWDPAQHIFLPNKAGFYHVTWICPIPMTYFMICKNDLGSGDHARQVIVATGQGWLGGAAGIVYLNGVGDYIRAWHYNAAAGTAQCANGGYNVFISIHRLGGE